MLLNFKNAHNTYIYTAEFGLCLSTHKSYYDITYFILFILEVGT